MSIDTTFLRRCIASLERAVEGIEGQEDRLDDMTRNSGEDFAEATLKLLPDFIGDARALADMIEREHVVVAGGDGR